MIRLLAAAALGAALTFSAACTSEVAAPASPGSTPTATVPTPPPTFEQDIPEPSDPEVLAFTLPTRVSERICSALEAQQGEEVTRLVFAYATPDVPPIAVASTAVRQSCPERLPAPDPGYRSSGEEQLAYLCEQDPTDPACAS